MSMNDFSVPFYEGMLSSGDGVIVSCPTKESAEKLADILDAHGIGFSTCSASGGLKFWNVYRQETCYYIYCKGRSLLYGTKRGASDEGYSGFIKCTFYEGRDPDIQDCGDAEQDLMAVLHGDI